MNTKKVNADLQHQKVSVTVIVCGRFHYHKYLRLLDMKGILRRVIYSYRINFNFCLDNAQSINFPLKEYLMVGGAKFIRGLPFYKYLAFLHRLWQYQVLSIKPAGSIAHFLVHGNCYRIMDQYKKDGLIVIGEVVNAHPDIQEELLQKEYSRYGMLYKSGEKNFKDKIIKELNICNYLLVPSCFVRASLIAKGISSDKIKVIPYGVEPAAVFKPISPIKKGEVIKLLYVGKITFRKGVVYILKALEILKSMGIEVTLTLIGSFDKEYLAVIEPYLSLPNVTHIAHVNNNSIYNVMKINDLLLVPSIEDGFGIVVAEALSVNLPVIVTRNCGASEIIVEGVNGFLIDSSSENAVADAVLKSVGHHFNCNTKCLTWIDYTNELSQFFYETLVK